MKHSKRKLTTLLCIIPLLLACSTQKKGEKAVQQENATGSDDPQKITESIAPMTIYVPADEDPGLFLYRNPTTRLEVVDFYNTITGKEMITQAILKNAETYDIPLALAFALAYGESDFNRWAINKNASSVDRGLYQLNSTTFPQLSETECFDPSVNARYALRHFQWCLNEGGNEVVAIAIYNAGRGRVELGGTPRVTLDHINNIIQYKIDVERKFLEWIDNVQFLNICFDRTALSEKTG